MRTVIVICGGWSVGQYDVADLRDRGYVIGVNESALLAQCDVGITMDRLWAEHRARNYFVTRLGELWVREGAAKKLAYHPRLRKFSCDHRSSEMSPVPKVFNGTNSGMVALNFAFQLCPDRVYVFGLDMQRGPKGQPYWYPPYEWAEQGATKPGKYKEWNPQFEKVAAAFRAVNTTLVQVNNRSMMNAIPSISYERFLEETK